MIVFRFFTLFFTVWICTTTAFAVQKLAQNETYRLAFFAPRGEGDPFWGQFIGFMEKATVDLGMELNVQYAEGNLEKMRQQIVSEAKSTEHADILVFPNFKKGGETFLKIIEEQQVPAFVVNSGFTEEEIVGEPRGKYKHWIGELLPAEEEVGAMLAESLIKEGLRLRSAENPSHLEMIGITGIVSDYAAIQRTKGLKHVVLSYPEIRLRQIVPANWNEKSAATSYAMLSRRYPKVTLIWSASDVMAQGVIRKAKKHGISPGKDVLIGGVDWAQAGLQAVRSGEQFISIGGHFLEGGWAVVLIYDYLSGSDFAKIKLRWRSKMGIVTAPKWEKQKKRLAKIQPDFVDFKRYSRFLNPGNTSYDFKIESLFNQE